MGTRSLVFPADTIVIRDPASLTEVEYTISDAGPRGVRTLTPVDPLAKYTPGLYMTTNNIPRMGGLIIQKTALGDWVIHNTSWADKSYSQRVQQIREWAKDLGLTKVKLEVADD
ncbi:hypothetical protein QDW26_gp62 [Microbacterium phage Didgeridoo]|uniref:hypothetical protein n=1 Tax=Microbacterium phage Didgeridoo TaxID=2126928 RepID=UPI000D203E71|nr:hypothetical protein QDW26_gp62 [Microbacterium phage Didgeridoo]AVR56728.1 hypothetical protein PBI_DIDGERIDOO_63 [Microbacterium phage Didgeridoo]